MRTLLLCAATASVTVLVLAGGAYGLVSAGVVDIGVGHSASFVQSGWFCVNRRASVDCQSGDAFPYATLTGSRTGGVTVVVHVLGGGQEGRLVKKRERGGYRYTFSALP